MVKKLIVWGEYGIVKQRLDEVREVRGPVTGRVYLWRKPGVAVKMDARDHAALFGVEQNKENDYDHSDT